MKNKKAIKRTKQINATSMVLTDSEGRVRIFMNADGMNGCAHINLYGKDGKSIQILTQPDDAIGIIFGSREVGNLIQIGIKADETGIVLIANKNGKLGTVLGEEPGTSTHRLLLFKDGKHIWNTPTGRKPPRKSKS
jgi:hypothetical protein